MGKTPDFDLQAAHRYFAANCFNQTWDLIDKKDRTPEEDEQMIRLCLASQYHWSQREDRSAKTDSIGYWQASRVYALVKQTENARRYAELCLKASQQGGVAPFYLGYAYEALARAEALTGDQAMVREYLEKAHLAAQKVTKAEDREALLADLNTIQVKA